MGIFDRMNRVVRSNLNAMIDKAEDPEKLINQTVQEMQSELKNARKELVTSLGSAKRLVKKAREHESEAERWEEKAVLALQSGDDELAREALKRKRASIARADSSKQQAYAAESAAEDMKIALADLETKVEDLESRKGTLAAQVRRAREAPGTEADGSKYGSSAFDDLDRMTNRIDQLEAEVEAANILDDPKRLEIEAKFRRLEKNSGASAVDDELAALKSKLNS